MQIGAKRLAGFDQPIEMLTDCHRRVEHFLQVLVNVESAYRGRFLDAEAIQALRASQTYFRTSAPKHTADEEQSLFPRLKSSLADESTALADLQQLEADHQVADQLHRRVDATIDAWCGSETPLDPSQAAQFQHDLHFLQQLYAAHFGLEEQQVFPAAARNLSAETLAEIGNEMRHRRQN